MGAADPQSYDEVGAAAVLARVLGQPGGGRTVLGLLACVPTFVHQPARRGGLLRREVPESLLVGEWAFVLVEPDGVRLSAQHIVRGIVLQSSLLGPDDAASQLAAILVEAGARVGPSVTGPVQAALYGLAGVG